MVVVESCEYTGILGPWRSVMPDSLRPYGMQYAGFPVDHRLPELAQTDIHQVGDAIQPSHPLDRKSVV